MLELAAQNAPVLRYLRDNPAPDSITALANALGRDNSNVGKSLSKLEKAGLTREGEPFALTTEALQILEGLDIAEGLAAAPAGGGLLRIPPAEIRANPLNPRRTFDADELAGLADSIEGTGFELLQPLVVSQPDASGARVLQAGERRLRAITALVDDGRWPEGQTVGCIEKAIPEGELAAQTAFVALVENGQRASLNPIEETRAYQALMTAKTWSARQAAKATGKNERVLQENIQVLAKATPEMLAEFERGEISWFDLRKAVREADPLVVNGVRFPNIARANEQRRILAGGGPVNSGGGSKRPAADDAVEEPALPLQRDFLEPGEELVLVELQAAIAARPGKHALGPAAALDMTPDLNKYRDAARLASEGYIAFASYPNVAVLLKPAQIYLSRMAFTLDEPSARLRKAREKGLDAETIARLEENGVYFTQWLNESNPPPKLRPEDALVLLEMADCPTPQGAYYGCEIDPAGDRRRIEELNARGLVAGPRLVRHRPYLAISHSGQRGLERAFPDYAKAKVRQAHLARVRAEVLGDDATAAIPKDGYATAWLNGPFELTAAAKAEVASEEDRVHRDRERMDADTAAREQRRAAQTEAVERLETEAHLLFGPALKARFVEVLAVLEGPAPWRPPGPGMYGALAAAANGARVGNNSDLSLRVMRLAVNMAAGVAPELWGKTPEVKADRGVFEAQIAKALQELDPQLPDGAAANQAVRALDRHLELGDLEFGEPSFEWSPEDAREIAADWSVDDAADQPQPAEA